ATCAALFTGGALFQTGGLVVYLGLVALGLVVARRLGQAGAYAASVAVTTATIMLPINSKLRVALLEGDLWGYRSGATLGAPSEGHVRRSGTIVITPSAELARTQGGSMPAMSVVVVGLRDHERMSSGQAEVLLSGANSSARSLPGMRRLAFDA